MAATSLKTGQGLDEDLTITHSEVIALHQGQAQIVGEIDMLEIGSCCRGRA